MGGCKDGWMDGWMDGQMDRDGRTCVDASTNQGLVLWIHTA